MNKFDLQHKVLMSDLRPEDKCLLIELILLSDDEGKSWPSVARLCKVRGIKHEKNFKGADHYLPGLVTKVKKGKTYVYQLNTPALEGVTEASLTRYQGSWSQRNGEEAPSTEGVTQSQSEVVTPSAAEVTPSTAGALTPATAEVTPSTAGVNSTSNTTRDSTRESTTTADAAVDDESFPNEKSPLDSPSFLNLYSDVAASLESTTQNAPSTAGVRPWTEERKRSALAYNNALRAKNPTQTIEEDW